MQTLYYERRKEVVEEIDVAMEYSQLASGGVSRSAEAGRSSAKKSCDAFCQSKGIGMNGSSIASCERLEEDEICTEKFFREFATYLTAHAVTGSGVLYKSGTSTQYLSAIKEMAMRKFPDNKLWEERVLERWYPSLRVAVEKVIDRRRMQNGLPVSESSLPIGRSLLLKICESLMGDGKVDSMKRRLALVTTFLAVGRAGEVACTTWTSASWDHDLGNLMMEWNEIKTGKKMRTMKNSIVIKSYHLKPWTYFTNSCLYHRRFGPNELL